MLSAANPKWQEQQEELERAYKQKCPQHEGSIRMRMSSSRGKILHSLSAGGRFSQFSDRRPSCEC